MQPRRAWKLAGALAALGVLVAFGARATVVYKWIDASGLVHYSDQPAPGAEKIVTATNSAPNAAATTVAAPAPHSAAAPPAKKGPPSALDYSQFSITSPVHDQTFFGDEPINVHLALDPALKPDQIITWHLNGKQLDDQGPDTTQFTLQSLARGTYTVAATITDQTSGESKSTDSVSFFVHQPSALSPQHRNP